jgi:hypothetical protein
MNNFEIRVSLRHYWKKGLSARAAAAEICKVKGEGTIGKTAAIKWFKRFEDGDFDFELFWTKRTCVPLWKTSRHRVLAIRPMNLESRSGPLSITCTSLILSKRSHDKILTNSLKHKLYDVLKSAANCSTIRWTIGSGSAL